VLACLHQRHVARARHSDVVARTITQRLCPCVSVMTRQSTSSESPPGLRVVRQFLCRPSGGFPDPADPCDRRLIHPAPRRCAGDPMARHRHLWSFVRRPAIAPGWPERLSPHAPCHCWCQREAAQRANSCEEPDVLALRARPLWGSLSLLQPVSASSQRLHSPSTLSGGYPTDMVGAAGKASIERRGIMGKEPIRSDSSSHEMVDGRVHKGVRNQGALASAETPGHCESSR
jgi:hypothetical protein